MVIVKHFYILIIHNNCNALNSRYISEIYNKSIVDLFLILFLLFLPSGYMVTIVTVTVLDAQSA